MAEGRKTIFEIATTPAIAAPIASSGSALTPNPAPKTAEKSTAPDAMRTAFARYGDTFGTNHSGADYDLEDLHQLVEIVERIEEGA